MRVNIRWAAEVTASDRARLEAQFGLVDGSRREGSTWSYQMPRPTASALRVIVRHESVADTHYIDVQRYSGDEPPPSRITVIMTSAAGLLPGIFLRSLAGVALVLVLTSAPLRAVPKRVDRATVLVAVAGAAPMVAMLATATLYEAGSAMGSLLLGPGEPLNLAEAAAVRDVAAIHRLVWEGADPDRPARIRRQIHGLDRQIVITPLEAAAANGRTGIIGALLRLGADMDEALYGQMICVARRDRRVEVVEMLEEIGAARLWEPDCDTVDSVW